MRTAVERAVTRERLDQAEGCSASTGTFLHAEMDQPMLMKAAAVNSQINRALVLALLSMARCKRICP